MSEEIESRRAQGVRPGVLAAGGGDAKLRWDKKGRARPFEAAARLRL